MKTIDIVSIRDKRIEYPDANEQEFLDLEEYSTMTKKLVKRYAGHARKNILASEDAMANICHEIMMADWRWDNTHLGETGQSFSRGSYRVECAKYAIFSFIKRANTKKNLSDKSYPQLTTEEGSFEEIIEDVHSIDPLELITENEETAIRNEKIESLLKSSAITDIEEACLRLHFYKNLTYQEIGKKIGLCRERIRQIINESITKLRDNYATRPSERKERRIQSI